MCGQKGILWGTLWNTAGSTMKVCLFVCFLFLVFCFFVFFLSGGKLQGRRTVQEDREMSGTGEHDVKFTKN